MKDENEIIQVVVNCNKDKKVCEGEYPFVKIKYCLPMVDACVVEIKRKDLDSIKNLAGISVIEMESHITAQANQYVASQQIKDAHKHNIKGKGIGVAILDTGIYKHPDFGNRIIAFQDFLHHKTEPYDNNGHGTHVAGIIAGDGSMSNGECTGVAPECNLIGVKVLDQRGNGNVTDVLAGLQWVIHNKDNYNIRVVNISVGTMARSAEDEESMLVKGVNAAWDAGLVVVVAAGNNGPGPSTITVPGISRKIITVGASDDDQSVEVYGSQMVDYSGRGPTYSCIMKPDLVAPGSNIMSCKVMNRFNGFKNQVAYTKKSGTSMSTPIVAGSIALLLGIHPELTNLEVKMKLKESTDDLGLPVSKQGWGLLNVKKLLS